MAWVVFAGVERKPLMVNVDTLKGITPDRLSDGTEAIRLWYADPVDAVAPGQVIVSTLLVRGDFENLILLLEAKSFS